MAMTHSSCSSAVTPRPRIRERWLNASMLSGGGHRTSGGF